MKTKVENERRQTARARRSNSCPPTRSTNILNMLKTWKLCLKLKKGKTNDDPSEFPMLFYKNLCLNLLVHDWFVF